MITAAIRAQTPPFDKLRARIQPRPPKMITVAPRDTRALTKLNTRSALVGRPAGGRPNLRCPNLDHEQTQVDRCT
jgi:hypothetical protein